MRIFVVVFWVVLALAIVLLVAGRLGLLGGPQPGNLGVREGRLKPPSKTPNSVSSQAALWPDAPQRAYAQIDPLVFQGDAAAAMARLRSVVESMPGARVVSASPDYLYAQFTTRWLKFVDDVEFHVPPGERVVHVRSASRVGRKDFGVNRQRIESIRARFAATSAG
jgi:uncharacterized protein (DUF1499 family)